MAHLSQGPLINFRGVIPIPVEVSRTDACAWCTGYELAPLLFPIVA